ncbi:urease accessory protein UreF [Phenylobacterium kunshanense]|nr:urease accessory UreF family protein [Phenylobacterium kunshanense]
MPTEARLLRLLTWLSPAVPGGSSGPARDLEAAIRAAEVRDAENLSAWIGIVLERGAWNDAVLFKAAWIAATAEDATALDDISDLAAALAPDAERRREMLSQGKAFLEAVSAWSPPPLAEAAYPVALGATAGAAGVPLEPALTAWLHAFASHLVDVAARSLPLDRSDAVSVIAGLEPVLLRLVARAAASALDDLDREPTRAGVVRSHPEAPDGRLFIG